MRATPPQHPSLALDSVRLRASFLRFVWIWNHHQGYGTPDLHLRIARWLERKGVRDGRRLALLVFRDAGKSTLVGLYCAWLLANDPDLRILVLAAEHALAYRMTRNVRRIVETHPLARHLRPKRKEEWAADRFTVHRRRGGRDPSLFARGIGANLTGTRADVIVCDDVEVPNTAASAKRRADLRLRLAEASFILVPNGLQLYVGTPHAWHSIYAAEPRPELGETRPFLDGCTRLVLPLIDAEGKSAWPERFSPAAVERLRAEVGPRLFQSQMLLEPTPIEAARLDPERLTFYDAPLDVVRTNGRLQLRIDGHQMRSACCWWDPAYGAPDKGDASVIACLFLDEAGGYWLHDLETLTFAPPITAERDELTQLCRAAALFAARNEQPVVTVETNGIGRFVPAALRRVVNGLRLPLRVVEHHAVMAKDARILAAFDPVLAAGSLRVHRRVRTSPFVTELKEWRPGGGGRDDALDAVSACILAQPAGFAPPPLTDPGRDWRGAGTVHAARTDFVL